MAYDLLDGVKVLELSMYAFAPSCAAVLADWGADVIKIVPPGTADPLYGKHCIGGLPKIDVPVSFMWEQLNRGKRCICIDVSTPDGLALLKSMLATADIFITNLLPSPRRRFGLDPEDIQAVNPKIIYARASGHGDKGPQRETGGFDHTDFWARTGIAHAASMAVGEFVPQAGPAIGDVSSGAFMAGGIAAALFRRERTGKGAVVDVSLLSSGVWAFAPAVIASQLFDVPTIPRLGHLDQPNPMVAAYTTRDGRQVYLSGILTEKGFDSFVAVVGHPELLTDPRFANGEARLANARECIGVLDTIFAERDLAEWIERLKAWDRPWAIVQSAAEAASDVQTVANGYVIPLEADGRPYTVVASPAQFDGAAPSVERAPTHGEHTELVLMEMGVEWDEIERLKGAGVIN